MAGWQRRRRNPDDMGVGITVPFRRRTRNEDDEILVDPRIPTDQSRGQGRSRRQRGALGNRAFPSASEARSAAVEEARRLDREVFPGHRVSGPWPPDRPGGLWHFHVVDPSGRQMGGHFFFGRRPEWLPPRRRERELEVELAQVATVQALEAELESVEWMARSVSSVDAIARTDQMIHAADLAGFDADLAHVNELAAIIAAARQATRRHRP